MLIRQLTLYLREKEKIENEIKFLILPFVVIADLNLGFGSLDILTRSIASIIHCIQRFIYK